MEATSNCDYSISPSVFLYNFAANSTRSINPSSVKSNIILEKTQPERNTSKYAQEQGESKSRSHPSGEQRIASYSRIQKAKPNVCRVVKIDVEARTKTTTRNVSSHSRKRAKVPSPLQLPQPSLLLAFHHPFPLSLTDPIST